MKKIEVNSIIKQIIPLKIIGIGTTAICFKIRQNDVLKLYLNTPLKNNLFKCYNMVEHLSKINEIGNNTFIVPDRLITKNNKLIAYTYPYVSGKSLKHIDGNTKMRDYIKNYHILYFDTKKISDKKFRLHDMHAKNIVFDKEYKIIDLDKGYFDEKNDIDTIFLKNMKDINRAILNSIYDLNIDDNLIFQNEELAEKYLEMIVNDPTKFYEFMLCLCNNNLDKTKNDIKRDTNIKIYSKKQYYKRF